MRDDLEAIGRHFPNVSIAAEFFGHLDGVLERHHGFTPGNTRFAEGACCDEINEPELQRLENYWGGTFQVWWSCRLLPWRKNGLECGESSCSGAKRSTEPIINRRATHRLARWTVGESVARGATRTDDVLWFADGDCRSRIRAFRVKVFGSIGFATIPS